MGFFIAYQFLFILDQLLKIKSNAGPHRNINCPGRIELNQFEIMNI